MAFLVVDDERFVSWAIARCIPPEEAVVIVHEADIARSYTATGSWSAFIIDVRIGDADGFELLQWARQHHPHTPALLVTGGGDPTWQDRAAALGAEIMTKPFDSQRLRSFVEDAARRAAQAGAPRDARASESQQARKVMARGKVLIVEEDTRTAEYVERMLRREGFSTTTLAPSMLPASADQLEPNTHVVTRLRLRAVPEACERFVDSLAASRPDLNVVDGTRQLGLASALMHVESAGWPSNSAGAAELRERLLKLLSRNEAPSSRTPASCASKPPAEHVMSRVHALVDKVAQSARAPVLLVGESGVGKEVLATRVHEKSPRRNGPFLKINVAAIADGMLEAELFGSVKGAFTDARRDRVGLIASANGGTLLLDEIGECRPEIQVKLLRVMETRSYYPVGSDEERSVDVRLIGATNRAPADVLAGGAFRTDLLFRFGTVITIPPLRERRSEIMPLAEMFALACATELGKGPIRFNRAAKDALESHAWPGNIRELKHVVEHAVLLAERSELTPELFELRSSQKTKVASPASSGSTNLAESRALTERAEIQAALSEAGGSATIAAKRLGIARSTLYEKLKKYGL